jgi:D-alanine-D-alanine ligase
MRILLLLNIARQARKGTNGDLSCEYEIEIIAPLIRDLLVAAGHEVGLCETGYDLWERLKAVRASVDLAFNLAEAFGGTNCYEPLVPAMLEALQIPCTGASAHNMALTLDKGVTKRIAQSLGVRTPSYIIAYDEIPAGLDRLRYPMIVKPLREEASIGISLDSVVQDRGSLLSQVGHVRHLYRQPALIEEFVDGRELSVGAVGNGSSLRILPVLEFQFPEAEGAAQRIRSYEYKWGDKKEVMVEARLESSVLALLRSWTAMLFQACECRDYARMDFRLNDGEPQLLEVNYNPGIGPNTHGLNNTLTMMASFEGRSFEELVLEIVEAAASREGLLAAATPRD